MKLSDLQQARSILIYGYGVEGKSTEQWLESQGLSEKVVIHDDKVKEYSSKKDLSSFDAIIVSAGIKRDTLPESCLKRCTSNTEIFFHNLSTENRAKCIGITGTKGKSMTSKLTFETLQKAGKKVTLVGNIGIAALDVLAQVDTLDYFVLELSSYQLTAVDVSPKYALCTNLFVDHLDWHGSIRNYHSAKENLWKHQTKDGVLLVAEVHKNMFPDRAIACPAIDEALAPEGSIWKAQHYRENFGIVSELIKLLGIDASVFKEALQHLKPLPHRLSTVGTYNGITFIDNAISTNIFSTIADLRFFGKRLGTLLLGGEDRGQEFAPLFEYISEHELPLHIIVLESDTQKRLIAQLEKTDLPFTEAKSMEQAVKIGYEKTPNGKICLLSPSASSWDRYNGYHEKGEDFKRCVQKNAPA